MNKCFLSFFVGAFAVLGYSQNSQASFPDSSSCHLYASKDDVGTEDISVELPSQDMESSTASLEAPQAAIEFSSKSLFRKSQPAAVPPSPVSSAPAPAPAPVSAPCTSQENLYTLKGDVGVNYTYMKLSPHDVHSSTGNLGGAQASIEFLPRKFLYEGATFLWRTGTLHSIDSKSTNIEDYDTQVRFGYVNTDFDRLRFVGFSGLGWRYIAHLLKSPGVDPLALNYNEVYIPVGFLVDYRICDCFSFGLNGVWMPEIYSTVNYVPLDNGRWITQCKLANYQVELPLVGYFNYKKITFSLEGRPFFQFWQDGKTLASTSTGLKLGLPRNNYYMGGCMLNFGASF